MDLKAKAVLKMVYVRDGQACGTSFELTLLLPFPLVIVSTSALQLMMLYPVSAPPSFAFHVVEVMSSPKYHLKEVGYLAAESAFPEGTEEVVLTVNGLKKVRLVQTAIRRTVGGTHSRSRRTSCRRTRRPLPSRSRRCLRCSTRSSRRTSRTTSRRSLPTRSLPCASALCSASTASLKSTQRRSSTTLAD